MNRRLALHGLALLALVSLLTARPSASSAQAPPGSAAGQTKRVLLIAGPPSHGYGAHEHYAGCKLLADTLNQSGAAVEAEVVNGWPEDVDKLQQADAIVIYSDGGQRHLALPHRDQLRRLLQQGKGFVCLHYAVEVPKGPEGQDWLDFLGGYFEPNWSVNPHWRAEFDELPEHPITRGVKPFSANDEWYFHMRFQPEMKGVTPILTDVPPESTMRRPDGPHSGNPDVRKAVAQGQPQHVAWAYDRPGGGRSFGFTGGHFHWNWGNDQQRRLVANAIAWTAGVEIPQDGLKVRDIRLQDLEQNQDYPPPKDHSRERIAEEFDLSQTDAPEHDPRRAVQDLDVADGLQATLAASEPLLSSLTNLDIDDRGRIWVCDVMNYRRNDGSRPEGDRILILEDTTGDGVIDTSKTYYQGRDINSAMGICVLGNQVIVSAAPYVWRFTDTDGDDLPDQKEAMFTETGQPQHDHSNHSFLFGPDGLLYWNFGNTGQQVNDAQGNVVVDIHGRPVVDNGDPLYGGMVFRCDMQGGRFEVIAHNFRNNYETTIDSFGSLWQSDNDDDGNRGTRINFVMEYGNYGYRDELTGASWKEPRIGMHQDIPLRHWHLRDPGVVPNVLQTGAGSPSGICLYEGRLLPQRFHDAMIHCEPGVNVVRAYPVQTDGAGYAAKIEPLLTGDRDPWFRPADVCVAPDGSLWVTDWYDPGVGGHQQKDIDRGRLFRIAPPGVGYRVPAFDYTTAAGAADALRNPNLAVRYKAWTALHAMGADAEDELLKLWADDNPRIRARALWLLGKIPDRGEHYVSLAMRDQHPDIRITAIRLGRQLPLTPSQFLAPLVHDPSPAVRREVLIALRHDDSDAMPGLWAQLANAYVAGDRWYLEALGIASDLRSAECFDAWLRSNDGQWDTPSGRDIVWRMRADAAAALLAQIVRDPSLTLQETDRYFRALEYHAPAVRNAALRTLLPMATDTETVAADKRSTRRTDAILARAAQRMTDFDWRADANVRRAILRHIRRHAQTPEFLALVKHFQPVESAPQLLQYVTAAEDDSSAVEAVRLLAMMPGGRQQLAAALDADDTAQAAQAARLARRLGLLGAPWVLQELSERAMDAERAYGLRAAAVRGLSGTPRGAQALVDAARQGTLPADLRLLAGGLLARSSDAAIRKQAAEYLPLPTQQDRQPMAPIDQLVTLAGDAARGETLFRGKGTCANCHTVNGTGKPVGPDLSEIGDKLSREAMFVSILDPNAGISHNYENHVALLDDGQVVSGVLVSQTDQQVTLRTAEAIDRVLPTGQIEVLKKSETSIMPENLHHSFDQQALVDIVQYMTTLKKKG